MTVEDAMKNGSTIRSQKNINLTNHLLEISYYSDNDREQIENNVLASFIKKIKDSCGSNKNIENILTQASIAINTYTSTEKEIIQKAFQKYDLTSQKGLESFMKNQINPPEHKIERKRNINYDDSIKYKDIIKTSHINLHHAVGSFTCKEL